MFILQCLCAAIEHVFANFLHVKGLKANIAEKQTLFKKSKSNKRNLGLEAYIFCLAKTLWARLQF